MKKSRKGQLLFKVMLLGLLGTPVVFISSAQANDVTSSGPLYPDAQVSFSDADRADAKSRMPMLDDASQLPPKLRELLGLGNNSVTSSGYGTGSHPFTTKRAATLQGPKITVSKFPYRATGKLYMDFGAQTFVCTASVIEKGILVTAAHCIWNYGGSPADAIRFEPAKHDANLPFGTWTAIQWYVPTVYANGTDFCTVSGIVCANDIAVVVLGTNGAGDYIQDVLGGKSNIYKISKNNYSYTPFAGLNATQMTQLGYPAAFDSGLRMIRTDSLGFKDTPNNVIIGSDQTGGSSGGPWLVNFGMNPQSISSSPTHNLPNRVMATTSWGFTSDLVKVQGASRFGKNSKFPTTTNIDALLNDACASFPAHCN